MPSLSGKQHRFMELIAHDPAAAHHLGVPQSVGQDFVAADKADHKHFNSPHHRKARAGGFHGRGEGHDPKAL